MCNNLTEPKPADKRGFMEVPGGEGNIGVTPSGSSSELCPSDSNKTTAARSLSMEDLYLFGGREEKQRSRSKRRRSTQICRENSKKCHRGSTKRKRHSYHNEHQQFLNFENEIIKISSRKSFQDLPPHSLMRNSSQRSSRKSSIYPEYARKDSLSSSRRKASISLALTEEELLKYKRRRRIVTVIIVTFAVLVFVCIMAVLVSLTHRSTVTIIKDNSTMNVTYYTFSPNAGVVCEFKDRRLCSQGK